NTVWYGLGMIVPVAVQTDDESTHRAMRADRRARRIMVWILQVVCRRDSPSETSSLPPRAPSSRTSDSSPASTEGILPLPLSSSPLPASVQTPDPPQPSFSASGSPLVPVPRLPQASPSRPEPVSPSEASRLLSVLSAMEPDAYPEPLLAHRLEVLANQ